MSTQEMSVADMCQRWRSDLLENVVPFWERHSLDKEKGGYYTVIDRDGGVLETTKYMWLQGRAVFMWSRLHNELMDEVGPATATRWNAAARLGAGFLSKGKDAEGRLLFAVSREGQPLHFQRKPYAAVFYCLACLEYAELQRVRAARGLEAEDAAPWLEEAVAQFEALSRWIREPHLLGRPPVPPPAPAEGEAAGGGYSNLADVMCLASLAEELLLKLPQQRERWMAVVADAQRRVAAHYDAERKVLLERAHATRGVSFDEPAGRVLNPGHSVEVAWFLLHLCRVSPDAQLQTLALDALEGSLAAGWDDEKGGLLYMLDVCGKPLMDCTVTAEHKLWWPVCEALYGLMLALELTADEARWLPWLRRVHAWIYAHLCDAGGGGEWFGYLRPDCSVFNACKGGNYKGFFHVPRCLLNATRSAERYLASKAAK